MTSTAGVFVLPVAAAVHLCTSGKQPIGPNSSARVRSDSVLCIYLHRLGVLTILVDVAGQGYPTPVGSLVRVCGC
ncbi:hypothetical protein C8R46DRAFT_1127737 [Mycena filopes]|nr:hypothetical protein C8R46DRAFT_1127737 [Mycena filopes]